MNGVGTASNLLHVIHSSSHDVTIHCECTVCRTKFRVPEHLARKKARCPKCQSIFLVPAGGDGDETPDDPVTRQRAYSVPVHEHAAAVGAWAVPSPRSPDALADTTLAAPGSDAWPPTLHIHTPPVAARVTRRRPADWFLWLAGLVLLALCITGLSLFVVWLTARSDPAATLVIPLPPEQRPDAAIFVNGQRIALPPNGRIELTLQPGTHAIALRRRGFDQIDATVELAPRQQVHLQPTWVPLTVGPGAVHDEKAPAASEDARAPE